MCAIAGYISFGSSNEIRDKVAKMLNTMRHRGPDNTEVMVFNENNHDMKVGLGHNRLSIIDLSDVANQPMANEDKTIWIIYNGEIYNFQELKRDLQKKGHIFRSNSDTEVIIHLYEDLGCACLEKLKGMFAFCIYDKKNNHIFIARDRFGKKPLYYYYKAGKFIFASEIKAIVGLAEIERQIEPRAIDSYFSLTYVPGPYTIYKEIFKLPPGHFMVLNKNGPSLNRYWDLNFSSKKMQRGQYLEEFRFLLERAIKLRLISDVPVGAFLSGGVDSSIILALMSQNMNRPVKAYSIGFKEKKHDELFYAKYIADYFNASWRYITLEDCSPSLLEKVVWHLDEPLADGATIPTYILAELAKKEVTVVLSGEGSDETLGGYPYYYYEKLISYYALLPEYMRKAILPFLLHILDRAFFYIFKKPTVLAKVARQGRTDLKQSIFRWRVLFSESEKKSLFKECIKKDLNLTNTEDLFRTLFDNCPVGDIINKALYIDTAIYLPDDLLMKMDKLTMAHSLEARNPYLDTDFIALVASLPVNLKVKGRIGKYILRKGFHNLVPEIITDRKKHGFTVPIDKWLKGGLRETCQEVFSKDGILKRSGIFNTDFIENLWNRMQDDIPDERLNRKLWALLNFAVWWRQNEKFS